jgi:RHS repeat-associated protein
VNVAAVGGAVIETGLTKYSYDPLYQLARQDHPNGTYEIWSYDAIGNRTSWRTNYGLIVPSTYFKNGTNTNNGQRLRNDGFGPSDYTYDANGNVTMNSTGSTFAWDYPNRLTSHPYGSYSYDHLGRRRSMTTNGTTTRYISEGLHTVGERNTSGGVSTDYVFGPGIDEPLAKHTANGAISYYGVDGLGSIVLTTDSSGIMTGSNRYSVWGAPAMINGDLFGYTGRERGGPSWLNRARYYDATTGRFLSEDPIQDWMPIVGGAVYGYVRNNPTNYDDPFGLEECKVQMRYGFPTVETEWSESWTLTEVAFYPNLGVGRPITPLVAAVRPFLAIIRQDCIWTKFFKATTYLKQQWSLLEVCSCPDSRRTIGGGVDSSLLREVTNRSGIAETFGSLSLRGFKPCPRPQ